MTNSTTEREASLKMRNEAFKHWYYSPDRLPLETPYGGDVTTGFHAGFIAGQARAQAVTQESSAVCKPATKHDWQWCGYHQECSGCGIIKPDKKSAFIELTMQPTLEAYDR